MKGYWGDITSNINWCEDDYVVSYYIAEFYNTISNLEMIFLALYGIYLLFKFKVPKYSIAHFALLIVGLGSILFHATLKYTFQLTDELPMIYGSLIFIYLVVADYKSRPKLTAYLPSILLLYAFTISFFCI